ncbi:hypothetical protein [Catenulispora rubra]|uniref:hypothetical protein n=1 Tax=Catenulispora rubra TaxID=280293 RepID=UPI0018926B25|nr:hypothetical protein [Catenulispora rubra]
MRIRTLLGTATAATAALAALAMLAGCGASKGSGASTAQNSAGVAQTSASPTTSPTTPSTPTAPTTSAAGTSAPSGGPSTSSARLAPALIQLSDLPAGFRSEGLTQRNLPSMIKGCPGLEVLQQSNIADQAQAEWTKGALDDYVDEAIIQPQGESAASLVDKASSALTACGAVKVTEEGLSVTLHATPLNLPQVGDASHAWHTSAKFGIASMEMNVVLIRQNDLVLLIAQTRVDGHTNDDLTLSASQAAAKRAADFQLKK